MALYDSIHKLEHGQDVTSLSRYHSQSVWMSLLLSQASWLINKEAV